MGNTTASIILDTRRAKKGGKYPVKLRVIYKRVVKYYPTTKDLSEESFTKIFDQKPGKALVQIRDDLFALQAKARLIIDKLPVFSFKTFETKLFKSATGEGDLVEAFNDYIAVLRLAGRISTAVSYECSMKSLREFKSPLYFQDITPNFLQEYELWMLGRRNSITTVGIYLRALRSVFNEAISDNSVSVDLYPFGKRKYQIPTGRNTKKALHLADIKKIYDYRAAPGTGEEKAIDFWLFSYLCNGINMKDIARLKYKNIEDDYLHIIRAKTERTTRSNPKPISIYLNDRAKEIIKRWGNKIHGPETYIFPILEPGCTPEREMQLVQQLIKTVNKWIKRVAAKIGVERFVTTYTARHSFSTVLKRSGASIEFISEALGHADLRTTENYLDSFENELTKKHAASLIAFEKNEP